MSCLEAMHTLHPSYTRAPTLALQATLNLVHHPVVLLLPATCNSLVFASVRMTYLRVHVHVDLLGVHVTFVRCQRLRA